MKKFSKILLATCLAFIVAFTTVSTIPIQVNAATSVSSKEKKKMRNLSYYFLDFVGFTVLESSKESFTKTYNFSKESDRKKMISYTPRCYKSSKFFGNKKNVLKKNISYNLFGKKTSAPNLKMSGEWGGESPEFKFKSYKKVNKKTYTMTVKLYDKIWGEYYDSADIRVPVGTVTFTLKKNSSAKYGYVVTKLKLHKTNNVW